MNDNNLDNTLKYLYDMRMSYIKNENIELERAYFSDNYKNIPFGKILKGLSFEDLYTMLASEIKYETEDKIEKNLIFLQEYLLFSYGHDLMYKKKLHADLFITDCHEELIYPMLSKAVKEKYNDLSVCKNNPNYNKNVEGIDKILQTYINLQTMLNFLYCVDFQFAYDLEKIFPDTYVELLEILKNSNITIKDYMYSLIDYKCKIMIDIINKINDPELRNKYLSKVEDIKNANKDIYKHLDLPITYFKDHDMLDFVDYTPNNKKIILSN